MMQIISQPIYDDTSLPLFRDLVGNEESYYIWSCPPDTMTQFLQNACCKSPRIFLGIKDTLDSWVDFNWWHDRQQAGSINIQQFARRHPGQQIVLFTSLERLELELDEPNLHIIPWGGDWVNQRTEYTDLQPVLDKNFHSDRTYINLNRHARSHRVVVLSYLIGKGYDTTGVLTYLKNPSGMPENFLDSIGWEFDIPRHDEIKEIILSGFDRLLPTDDDYNIYQKYGQKFTDTAGNFENRLRNMYQNSFVEIVSETGFAAHTFFITEKTAHAFYGCNFPIILSGCGTVAHLRELGLDVFDDVVDHSYDQISNPFDRIIHAIESNRTLLTDTEYVKQAWKTHRSRFERNVAVMRDIYSWYEQRTRQKFAETLELIG
jgi:hypothetical protein